MPGHGLNLVRQIIADFPRLSQAELAYTICELMEWRRPNGKLKSPECVEWLQKWQQQVLPALPELRVTKPRGAHRPLANDPLSDPQPPLHGRLADYQPYWAARAGLLALSCLGELFLTIGNLMLIVCFEEPI